MSDEAGNKTKEIVKAAADLIKGERTPLVIRSEVKAESDYQNYRETLRFDFFYSCAYCTTSEAEGAGIGFEIDHYEPQSTSSAVADYSNLMYSCRVCNRRKTNVTVPPEAQAGGYKIFRSDQEFFDDHFELQHSKLKEKTNTGKFTISVADLNRPGLRKLREIRERLYESHDLVTKGLRALANVRIDRLPSRYRPSAKRAISDATEVRGDLTLTIDEILRNELKSPLINPDPELASRLESRKEMLAELKTLFPGTWGGQKAAKVKSAKKSGKSKG